MTLTLNQDVIGHKNTLYARKGEKVELISDVHYPVLLVRSKDTGESFPVRFTGTDYEEQKKKLKGV